MYSKIKPKQKDEVIASRIYIYIYIYICTYVCLSVMIDLGSIQLMCSEIWHYVGWHTPWSTSYLDIDTRIRTLHKTRQEELQ